MVTCDTFELEVSLTGEGAPVIAYSYWTDLPAGTVVSLECSRWYLDHEGRRCLWTLHDARLAVSVKGLGDFNGGSGRIDVISGDREALAEFEATIGSSSKGINSQVSDDVTVSLCVGARQPLRAFGPGNAKLSGQMVARSGGVQVVTVAKSVRVPLQAEFYPVVGDR